MRWVPVLNVRAPPPPEAFVRSLGFGRIVQDSLGKGRGFDTKRLGKISTKEVDWRTFRWILLVLSSSSALARSGAQRSTIYGLLGTAEIWYVDLTHQWVCWLPWTLSSILPSLVIYNLLKNKWGVHRKNGTFPKKMKIPITWIVQSNGNLIQNSIFSPQWTVINFIYAKQYFFAKFGNKL